MSNRYKGSCKGCNKLVAAGAGNLERIGRKWAESRREAFHG